MTNTEINNMKRTLEVQKMINATYCKTLEEVKDLTIMTLMDLNNLMDPD